MRHTFSQTNMSKKKLYSLILLKFNFILLRPFKIDLKL